MQFVVSVKMEYQYAHVYLEWLEAHLHADQNVYLVEIVHYSRPVLIKSVKIRVLEHVAVSTKKLHYY